MQSRADPLVCCRSSQLGWRPRQRRMSDSCESLTRSLSGGSLASQGSLPGADRLRRLHRWSCHCVSSNHTPPLCLGDTTQVCRPALSPMVETPYGAAPWKVTMRMVCAQLLERGAAECAIFRELTSCRD